MTNLDDIMGVVTEVYDVYREALQGPSRLDMVVEARHAFCYMGSQLGFTQDYIAAAIGRDRSCIGYAVMSFKARVDCDPRAHEKFVELKEEIRNLHGEIYKPKKD